VTPRRGVLWRVFCESVELDGERDEGLLMSGDQVMRLSILRFLRLREKLRVKVLVVKGVMDGFEFRL